MVNDRRGMSKEKSAPVPEIIRPKTVPFSELVIASTRSSGPGGQGVNTTNSCVEVRWNVRETAAFTADEKALIEQRLPNRINKKGEITVSSSEQRSNKQNKETAIENLNDLIQEALKVDAPRETAIPQDVKKKADAARFRDKNHAKRLKAKARGGFDD